MTTMAPAPLPSPLLETLLRMAPLDVLLFDTELVCRFAALADDTLFGRTAAEFVGQPADAIFPPIRGDLRSALELAATSPTSYQYPSYRYTYTDTSGTTETAFCWSVRVEPVTLHDYRGREEFRGVLVTLADVLDLSDENDRLRSQVDELQRELDRLRRELAAARAQWPVSREPPAGVHVIAPDRQTPAGANRLLASLPPPEYQRLLPELESVSLAAQDVLYEPGAPVAHVYFPVNCVVSLLTVMANGAAAEAATVGREGMIGLPVFPGSDSAFSRALCQVPGDALRLPVPAFRAALARGGALSWVVQRYVQVLFHQVMQTAACNRLHRVEQRGARWLLQIHDAVGADQFALTQESLALMLSVQRPTVTLVAGMLRQAGAIDYSRGRVTVVGRAALEVVACDCYRVMQAQFAPVRA